MTKKKFIHDDFLLESRAARALFHEHAKDQPIIDYHCHLPPVEIAQDKRWDNVTQLWLYGDHYKWRAMRTAGIDERFCTGDASDWEKFQKFAGLMPKALRNPLYHWTHLELARYFGIDNVLLGPDTAKEIYDECNRVVTAKKFSCRSLMKQSKVEVVCTTDDPIDSLEHHIAIAEEQGKARPRNTPEGRNGPPKQKLTTQVRPTWRPDKAWQIDRPKVFGAWLEMLEAGTGAAIATLDDLFVALRKRHDFFAENGCRLSDRGIETVWAADCTRAEAAAAFAKFRAGKAVTPEEALKYKSFVFHELAVMDAEKGWTMQLHYGAIRNNNTRLFAKLGPDIGCDSIGDWPVAEAMSKFFARLDEAGRLPRTIIYNLNPAHNELIAAMIGNFQDGSIAGKMQFGSGWWFLDQLDGMARQIEALSQLGLLSQFVGMLTDSRSFLSYTRHEYFRRLLCNILGRDMERGLLPNDLDLVGGLVQDISYRNARAYFGFYD